MWASWWRSGEVERRPDQADFARGAGDDRSSGRRRRRGGRIGERGRKGVDRGLQLRGRALVAPGQRRDPRRWSASGARACRAATAEAMVASLVFASAIAAAVGVRASVITDMACFICLRVRRIVVAGPLLLREMPAGDITSE